MFLLTFHTNKHNSLKHLAIPGKSLAGPDNLLSVVSGPLSVSNFTTRSLLSLEAQTRLPAPVRLSLLGRRAGLKRS